MTVSFTALGSKDGPTIGVIADYFLGSSSGDYFLKGGEEPGFFLGQGAVSLGLRGQVTKAQFINLLAGNRPNGSEFIHNKKSKHGSQRKIHNARQQALKAKAGKKKRRERCEGVDLTFSVPKTVSIIWALSSSQLRKGIEQAFLDTIHEAVALIEKEIPLARRLDQKMVRELASAVVAVFVHPVNREQTPQLHAHMIFTPQVKREDNSWSALYTKPLRDWARTLGPIMRQSLATKLQQLGLPVAQAVDSAGRAKGWFEIAHVPESLVKAWSPRRNDIEKFFESQGQAIGNTTAIAREYAALTTREAKQKTPPRPVLFQRWADEARSHGFSAESITKLIHAPPAVDVEKAYAAAKQAALQEVVSQDSAFTWRKLIQLTSERMQHIPMTGQEIAVRLRNELDSSPAIVRLGVEQGDERYTTKQLWNLEKKLLQDVEKLASRTGARLEPEVVAQLISTRGLQGEQATATRKLLTDSGAIRCLYGIAGAGKTTVLDPVAQAFTHAGFRVIGASVAGAAKEKLALETGIPSRTIASYLYHLDQAWAKEFRQSIQQSTKAIIQQIRGKHQQRSPVELNEKTVLIIDEAGMLDTRSTARLLHHAVKAKATVIFVGDPEQLPPIGAGAPFRTLIEKLGNAAILSVNYRQQAEPADRDAAHLIRHGEARAALASYAERGRLMVAENRAAAISELVQSWKEHGGAERPQGSMIFTQTRSEARTINRLCQGVRQQTGQVSTEGVLHEGQQYCRGDRILFHKPLRSQGIENGFGATILKINPQRNGFIIHLDHPPSPAARAKGARQFTTISLADLPSEALTLFYASTTHKMQGQSVDQAFLLLGGRMTDREMGYVQATRGRHGTRLFVDKPHAGEELADLARALDRSHRKELAHNIALRTGAMPALEQVLERRREHG